MDISLLYIGAVIVILALGFVFALRMAMAAIREADGAWPQALEAVSDVAVEPRTRTEPAARKATTEPLPTSTMAVAEPSA